MKLKLKWLLFLWWNILIAGLGTCDDEHEEYEKGANRVRRESYYSWRQRLRKTKEAADKYDGPIYKPSDWKTGRADEIVWGVANYKRSLLYKRNPDKAPTVCFNPLDLRGGTHAYFVCPEEGQDLNEDECCGPEYGQECCEPYNETETSVNPLLFWILIPCVLGLCGGLAYWQRSRSRW